MISVMHILGAPFQSMYSKSSVQISSKYDHVLIDIAWLKHLFSWFMDTAIVIYMAKYVIYHQNKNYGSAVCSQFLLRSWFFMAAIFVTTLRKRVVQYVDIDMKKHNCWMGCPWVFGLVMCPFCILIRQYVHGYTGLVIFPYFYCTSRLNYMEMDFSSFYLFIYFLHINFTTSFYSKIHFTGACNQWR